MNKMLLFSTISTLLLKNSLPSAIGLWFGHLVELELLKI